MKLKSKSLSLHTEFMFARSMHQARDMDAQHRLLERVAQLIDQGHIRTTLGKQLGKITAASLRAMDGISRAPKDGFMACRGR